MGKYIVHEQLAAIAARLKSARARKGLSQRALAAKTGMPQSQISKIENAAVDLQTTSLIALARALDLEVMLVPREILPAVQTIQRESEASVMPTLYFGERLNHLIEIAEPFAKRSPEAKSLKHTLGELRGLRFDPDNGRRLVTLLNLIEKRLVRQKTPLNAATAEFLDRLTSDLRSLRNAMTHGRFDRFAQPRPAYSLDDDNG